MGTSSKYSIGSIGGEEQHTLSISEMPSHSHGLAMISSSGTSGNKLLSEWNYGTQRGNYSDFIYESGQDQPHNNMPPYVGLHWIMKL